MRPGWPAPTIGPGTSKSLAGPADVFCGIVAIPFAFVFFNSSLCATFADKNVTYAILCLDMTRYKSAAGSWHTWEGSACWKERNTPPKKGDSFKGSFAFLPFTRPHNARVRSRKAFRDCPFVSSRGRGRPTVTRASQVKRNKMGAVHSSGRVRPQANANTTHHLPGGRRRSRRWKHCATSSNSGLSEGFCASVRCTYEVLS